MRRRLRDLVSVPGVLVLTPALVLAGAGVAWATWTATVANPTSTISANSDITAPTVTAAAGVRTATPQLVQHVTEGAAYQLYAAVSDGGSPASGVSTVKADLSAITSGQAAASLTAGNAAAVGGVSYGYGTASLTAGSSLPLCRYSVPITAKDVAGNTSAYDQQVMVDRTLTSSGSLLRIDGAQSTSGVGWTTVPAGDVNGDGRGDWLVSAVHTSLLSRSTGGAAYVVFGQATSPITVDLANLGTKGYAISGAAANDQAGYSVAALGDVNGDGKPDQLVGAKYADNNGRADSGSFYVIFAASLTGNMDLASGLGTSGFRIDGAVASDELGEESVASLGDLNGDGTADLAVGSEWSDYNSRGDAGAVFVVFGHSATTNVDLAALGTSGYRIEGAYNGDKLGISVGAAGDVNGDGKPDLVVGAYQAGRNSRSSAGAVYVIWGKTSSTTIDTRTLGSAGYEVDGAVAGDMLGRSVAGIGDVDGDSVPDVLAGASGASEASGNGSGAAYVLFGRTSGNVAVDLSSYGTGGYRFESSGIGGDKAGAWVADAGDLDGDGVHDLVVGAPGTDSNSNIDGGSVYVVHTPTCSYKQAVLQTSGLKSYWRLNATSGTLAADSKGSVLCSSYGPYTPGVAGALSDGDKAASFASGSAQWCGDVYDFAGITPFSVEAWIKVSTPSLDGNFHRIVSKETWTGSFMEGWDLELSPAGGYPGIGLFANIFKVNRWHNGNGSGTSTANNTLTVGRWYHVVLTTDASTTSIYVNGQLAGSNVTSNSIVDGSSGLLIGPGSASAAIDEVAIYDVALTQTQIQQHYALR